VSEARSHQRRGNNTPTLMKEAVRHVHEVPCCMSIRRSVLGRRETSGPPVMPYGA